MLLRAFGHLRSVLVIAGLAFAAIELGAACLDHFEEDYGRSECLAAEGGVDCGAAPATGGSGSGTAK